MGESLKSDAYASRLLTGLQDLKASNYLTDLNIIIDESQASYPVHKCVVVASSRYFSTLVKNDQLSDSNCLIKGIETEHWSNLLDFIYTGELRLDINTCVTLHDTAEQLGIDEAVHLCEQYMLKHSTEQIIIKNEPDDDSTVNYSDDVAESLPNLPESMQSMEPHNVPSLDQSTDVTMTPRRGTRSRRGPKYRRNDDDPDWGMSNAPKRKKNQDDNEPKPSTSQLEDSYSDSNASKKTRYVLENDAGGVRPEIKGLDNIPAKFLKPSQKQLRSMGQFVQHSAWHNRKMRRDYKFTRFGRPLGTVWSDDSMIVRELPAFKCKRCQYRFFHASALCLHSYHKHGMSYPSASASKAINIARRTAAANKSLTYHGGIYTCDICESKFINKHSATSHFHHKHVRTTVRCVRCETKLPAGMRNRAHRCTAMWTNRKSNVSRVIFCRHCPSQFRHSAVGERHYVTYHPDENYEVDMVADLGHECRHCKRSFPRIQPYIVHLFGHGLNDKEVDLEFSDPSRVVLRSMYDCEPDDHDTMPFKCPDCPYRFSKAHRLDIHMMLKHKKRVNKPSSNIRQCHKAFCVEDGCSKVFSRMPDLRGHIRECHKHVNYSCPSCKYSTILKFKMDGHMHTRHPEEEEALERTCSICNRIFDKTARLKIHMVQKHSIEDASVKRFNCQEEGCKYVAFQRYTLEVHKRKHETVKQHTCEHCGKKYKTARSVQMHIKTAHLNIRPWVCDICGANYAIESELRRHMKRHNDVKQYQCELCDYASHEKGNFQSHMFSKHERFQDTEGKKNVWTCEQCGYKCNTKNRIQEHMDSHNKVKRHVCATCGDAFVARYSLNYHVRKVHEGVQFECKFCTYKAPTTSKLNFHMRTKHTHVGVKPYKCFYCDFHSANSGSVNKHVQKKHPGMQYKWVKVGTFDSLPPHHDVVLKGHLMKPLAVAPNPQFNKGPHLRHIAKQPPQQTQNSYKAELRAGNFSDNAGEQFFLMTQVENGVQTLKLISKEQLDLLNVKQALKGEDRIEIDRETQGIVNADSDQLVLQYVADQALSGSDVTFDQHQLVSTDQSLDETSIANQLVNHVVPGADLVQQAAAAIQLSGEQLEDTKQEDMQVIYVPSDMMHNSLVMEDGVGNVTPEAAAGAQMFTHTEGV